MKRRLTSCRLLGLAFVLSVTIYTRSGVCSAQDNRNAPVSASSAIAVPGNPITSSDIAWADSGTKRYYFADRSNFGVDVIDAVKDVWVGRVGGMAGPLTSGGGTSTTNGPGPNGVVVTPLKRLWAGDRATIGSFRIADHRGITGEPKSERGLRSQYSTASHICSADPRRAPPTGLYSGKTLQNPLTIDYFVNHQLFDDAAAMRSQIIVELFSGSVQKRLELNIRDYQQF
jgi:hypothetical protein